MEDILGFSFFISMFVFLSFVTGFLAAYFRKKSLRFWKISIFISVIAMFTIGHFFVKIMK